MFLSTKTTTSSTSIESTTERRLRSYIWWASMKILTLIFGMFKVTTMLTIQMVMIIMWGGRSTSTTAARKTTTTTSGRAQK